MTIPLLYSTSQPRLSQPNPLLPNLSKTDNNINNNPLVKVFLMTNLSTLLPNRSSMNEHGHDTTTITTNLVTTKFNKNTTPKTPANPTPLNLFTK